MSFLYILFLLWLCWQGFKSFLYVMIIYVEYQDNITRDRMYNKSNANNNLKEL